MKISQLIQELQKQLEEHGDLKVCYEEDHEYWGSIYNEINEFRIDKHAQPDGPKSGKSETCLIACKY